MSNKHNEVLHDKYATKAVVFGAEDPTTTSQADSGDMQGFSSNTRKQEIIKE